MTQAKVYCSTDVNHLRLSRGCADHFVDHVRLLKIGVTRRVAVVNGKVRTLRESERTDCTARAVGRIYRPVSMCYQSLRSSNGRHVSCCCCYDELVTSKRLLSTQRRRLYRPLTINDKV